MSDRFEADADEMRTRQKLTNYVESELTKNEQETGISFFGDADRFQIISYGPPLVKNLLEHEYADIRWLYVAVRDGQNFRADTPSEVWPGEDGHRIEGLCATLPLGALSVKGSPRKRDILSGIVTTPAKARNADRRFGGEDSA